jgi:hypothetical protein
VMGSSRNEAAKCGLTACCSRRSPAGFYRTFLRLYASVKHPLRVVSASSVFSGADAQIRSADDLVITWPASGLAEEQSLPAVILTVRSWPIADMRVSARLISPRRSSGRLGACPSYRSSSETESRPSAVRMKPSKSLLTQFMKAVS